MHGFFPPGLTREQARPGTHVHCKGRVCTVIHRGTDTALVEDLWSGKRERVPLAILSRA
ncbi:MULTISPECIES: hypothetical protein [Halorhodospira]|uniref:hypothetical protein n=1 Tax=Halorhodospira TaxID=85108 RepID=UPI001EE7BC3B|nr:MULTISPECIES: hypothetical protein [Halorhodospira]MCG5528598.1 hypothetical protein [Halorhodospira halophila]MCG5543739.1 hypothetical protein [Halorhodospira sp. 9628]